MLTYLLLKIKIDMALFLKLMRKRLQLCDVRTATRPTVQHNQPAACEGRQPRHDVNAVSFGSSTQSTAKDAFSVLLKAGKHLTIRSRFAVATNLPSNTDCMRAHTVIDIRPPRPPLRDLEAEANGRFHPAVLSGELSSLFDAVRTQFFEARACIHSLSQVASYVSVTSHVIRVITQCVD
ncbi:hypothetical protein EV424DRAFT_1539724 [Suillus variegatus]|nr:hypothetical protein EV424DRAFT_1539724 [Suillus variegatus]